MIIDQSRNSPEMSTVPLPSALRGNTSDANATAGVRLDVLPYGGTAPEAVVAAHHLQVGRADFVTLVDERLDYFERKVAEDKDRP